MLKKLNKKVALTALFLGVCIGAQAKTLSHNQPALMFLGENQIATGTTFKDIQIGGLSGIWYDQKQELYYAISDSRNTPQEGLARVYTLKINTSAKGIEKVEVKDMFNLVDEKGQPWVKGAVDAEGIAPTPDGKGFYWTSELGSPLRIMDAKGNFVADLAGVIPDYYNPQGKKDDPIGVRSGLSFEGLSVTPDGKTLFIALESALKQDGPLATTVNSTPVRVLKYQINQKDNSLKLTGEFIYNTDAIPQVTSFGVNDNGVSEILAVNENKAIIIERAGRNASEGFNDFDFDIRVYLADFSQSSNIMGTASLSDIKKVSTMQTVQKRLLIDFNNITDKPDCIEAVAFGPEIDGKKTLVFASDNNFQPYQSNKFFLFQDNQGLLNN